jgi:WD40 repeat protein
VLNSCRRAKGAEFRHDDDDRRGCLKGTRECVLAEIEHWTESFDMSPVYWLNGLAGTGKSTIAQTIAERLFADGRLGASFFCSRDFRDRRDLRYIFPTLAFQLAHKYPEFRSFLIPLLQSNPDIAHESLYNQMEMLIAGPLASSATSTVIVIDALDECVDEDPQSAILSVIGRLAGGVPNVKFFITGRPEPRIQSGFRLGLLRPLTDVFVLHDVEPSVINTDIRLFLEHGLSELAKRRGVERDDWPTDQHLDLLCERAAGLFVYAVATIKFLDHAFTPPTKQLDIIIRSPEITIHEGKTKVRPSTTLDSLYISCFQGAFGGMGAEDDEKVRIVVGTVVLAVNPLPPSAIASLVDLGKREVMDLLRMIQSLLKLNENPNIPVLPFHKSFPDFITDPLRCPSDRFHISPETGHLRLALSCLKLINNNLGQNLLSLPDYALNSEVQDLEIRVKDHISDALQYACKSWYSHLTEVRGDVVAILSALRNFLQEGFLAWLEVLSVIGATRDAVVALERLMHWLQEVCFVPLSNTHITILTLMRIPNQVTKDDQLLDTARDYFQFATNFFEVITVSATHVYHSALELSPLSSTVRKLYYSQRPHPLPRVVLGTSDFWGPSATSVSTEHSYYLSSTWSPCGQFVAAVAEEVAEIWDAPTLKPLSTLQSIKVATKFKRGLAYSPDGRSLAGCSDIGIVIWDTQTGGVIKVIGCEVPGDGLEPVWSLDGEAIGAISPRIFETLTVTVHMYDVVSGIARSPGVLQSRDTPYLWAHGNSFRIATTASDRRGCRINIFEVGSTLTRIEPFPIHFYSSLGAFSPTTYRVSISVAGGHSHDPDLLILDVRSSEVLLRETGSYWRATFSPDGTFFAAFATGFLHLWRYGSGSYIRWKEFRLAPTPFQFSPTLSSIVSCTGTLLHVLYLDHSPDTPATEPIVTTGNRLQDAFSPDSTYIATVHCGESTVTITNLDSQHPSPIQFIDTDLEISAIVLTGNVLLVKGSDMVVAWLLADDGMVDGILGNPRADRNDSIWELPTKVPTRLSKLFGRGGGNDDDNNNLGFSVGGETAAITLNGLAVRTYHTGTGESLKSGGQPRSARYRFHHPRRDECNLYHRDLSKHRGPLESDWPVSETTLQEGWVKDPEGKHRLWLPARWRQSRNEVDWLHGVTALRLRGPSELVVVKF